MPHVGEEIVNPRTGQRMTFLDLSSEQLRIETVIPPSPQREPLHIHPKQESGVELVAGSLLFEVAGEQRRVDPGETIVIPAGTPHRFWNDGHEDAHAIGFFRPALDTAAFFETLFALAQQGKLDEAGMPRPFQLAVMIPAFADEIRPTSPPWPLLRVLAALLGPIARLRGYRARVPL